MKAIMISIQPKWVEKILNGEKTIEVRKRFPSDYVGWVYIYCTKGKQEIGKFNTKGSYEHSLNGKVVARFWCDKVDCYDDIAYWSEENEKATCLTPNDFFDYMFHIRCCRSCRFIHITKLEIFDEPKELSEFNVSKIIKTTTNLTYLKQIHCVISKPLTKAPQSWQYIEVFENE